MPGFQRIPSEIFQLIAVQVSDKDLISLNATCRSLRAELHDPSFWRIRFHHEFDMPIANRNSCKGLFKLDCRRKYQLRKALLFHDAPFSDCRNPGTQAVINAWKEVIIEALPFVNSSGKKECKNFLLIEEFVNKSSLFKNMLRLPFFGHGIERRPVETVLVALAAHFFDLELFKNSPMYGFEYSQAAAYQSAANAPIVHGPGNLMVNMSWVLETLNYFRHHLHGAVGCTGDSSDGTQSVHEAFERLSQAERPHTPSKQLKCFHPDDLGRVWRGSYSYLKPGDIQELRTYGHQPGHPYVDHNMVNKQPLQIMKMFRPSSNRRAQFQHDQFEEELQSFSIYDDQSVTRSFAPYLLPQSRTTIDHAKIRQRVTDLRRTSWPFEAIGWDDEEFRACGWVNPLPNQNGIPGFARFTMMKYFETGGVIDRNCLWAYEGVILPGGQIMVGRWWSPSSQQGQTLNYSGPFIQWNVEAAWDRRAAAHVSDHQGLEPGTHQLRADLY